MKTVPLPITPVVVNGPRNYDITPDGKDFIFMERLQADSRKAPAAQINVTLNWFEEPNQHASVR